MPRSARTISRDDLLPIEDYTAQRKEKRKEAVALKRNRRMEVGPHATFYFESFETMWHQIHEMLYIEKGGEEQIADELAAYNPLIPQGQELVATLMFEVDDEARRARLLAQLGGVEDTVTITIGSHVIKAKPEMDVERTNDEGKASSVHFLHFRFSNEQIEAFKVSSDPVVLAINKEKYQHMAVMPDAVRQTLAADFA